MPCVLSDEALRKLLHEDCPCGDLTTEALGIGGESAWLTFSARSAMTACCSEEAARMFELNGGCAAIRIESGNAVAAGTILLEAKGTTQVLHQTWKVAQTLMEATSGIASATRAMIDVLRAAGLQTPVACTRKNFPGTKALAVKAIKAGGATMHRLGLSETILIFPEHLMFSEKTPEETVREVRACEPEKKVVVEVKDVSGALNWARAGADVLQLEKFTPDAFRECLAQLNDVLGCDRPKVSAAGGVNISNVLEYARAGADFLVTSSPYWASPADVQVTLGRYRPRS